MTVTTAITTDVEIGLGPALIGHLDEQLRSAERLLDCVLRQAGAISDRVVDMVLRTIGEIQAEMERRGLLEQRRNNLLASAAERLGVPAHAVTLDALCGLLDEQTAELAQQRSAQLRGLLAEIQQRHTINRALMRQELAFLDHLTRLLGSEGDTGAYGPGATSSAGDPASGHTPANVSTHRVVDLEA